MASMASLFLLIALMTFVPEYIELQKAYHAGQFSITEGVVESFRPAPELGAASESFSVNREIFSYNVLDDSPCFHDSGRARGRLRNGIHVRIYHGDTCIQRIDLLQETDGTDGRASDLDPNHRP